MESHQQRFVQVVCIATEMKEWSECTANYHQSPPQRSWKVDRMWRIREAFTPDKRKGIQRGFSNNSSKKDEGEQDSSHENGENTRKFEEGKEKKRFLFFIFLNILSFSHCFSFTPATQYPPPLNSFTIETFPTHPHSSLHPSFHMTWLSGHRTPSGSQSRRKGFDPKICES